MIRKSDFEDSLRLHPPFGDYQGDFAAVRVQASSGTSGNPKPFFFTRNDWDIIARLWSRRFHAQGVREGDILQIVFAYTLFIVGFTASEGAMRLGALVVPTGSGSVTPSERQVKIARDWGTTVLAGTPSYVLHLADVAEEQGFDLRRDFRLRRTIHTSETMTEAARRAIERPLGRGGLRQLRQRGDRLSRPSSARSGTATTSTRTPTSSRCWTRPPTSRCRRADEGVLVVTCLFKEAAPVIRYNIEDLCEFIEEPCGCGRTFRRISKLQGPPERHGQGERHPVLSHVGGDRAGAPAAAHPRVSGDRGPGGAAGHAQGGGGVAAGLSRPTGELRQRLERELKVATSLTMEAVLLSPGELGRSLGVENRIKVRRIRDRRAG